MGRSPVDRGDLAGSSDRIRHRQGKARIVRGVPYGNRKTTLSLLSNAANGRWLASQAEYFRGRLLDAGCGNQPYREWYEPLVKEVRTVDAAPVDGLDVVGFVHQLPFADESFDTILCTSVLEHVPDPERAVAELARVLRRGGHLIVVVPFMYPVHEPPYDFTRFTHYGLREIMSGHGLRVVRMGSLGGAPLLVVHYGVLAVVGALQAASARLGRLHWLLDNPIIRALVWLPQEAARTLPRTNLSGSARRVSLAYAAVVEKPAEP